MMRLLKLWKKYFQTEQLQVYVFHIRNLTHQKTKPYQGNKPWLSIWIAKKHISQQSKILIRSKKG